MEDEIKRKLENAGFEITGNPYWDMSIVRPNSDESIWVNLDKKVVGIYIESRTSITEFKYKDADHINKICYPFNGCKDLNFEGKLYTWEECYKKKGFFTNNISEVLPTIKTSIDAVYKNTFKERSQACASIAFACLTHICAEINKDFELDREDIRYYPVLDAKGRLSYEGFDKKLNQLPMNSDDAVMKLIETNSDLLYQYFETEKPC